MKIRHIHLTDAQRKELEQGHREGKSLVFRKRCQLIHLKSQARSSGDVGKILGWHQVTVNNWLSRYEQEGIEGLKTKSGRGRKAILSIEHDAEMVKAIVKEDRQRLKQAKAVLGKQLSTKTLKRFLKNLMPVGHASAAVPNDSQNQNRSLEFARTTISTRIY